MSKLFSVHAVRLLVLHKWSSDKTILDNGGRGHILQRGISQTFTGTSFGTLRRTPPPYPGDTPYITKEIQYPPHESEPMLPTSAILRATNLEFHPGEYLPAGVQYIPQPNTVVTVTTPPPLGAVLNGPSEAEVNTYLCCSIFNFLCCCPFIGLVAVYLSGKECYKSIILCVCLLN